MSEDTSTNSTLYEFNQPITARQVLDKAAEILSEQYKRGEQLSSPSDAKPFLQYKLATQEREVFSVLLLDSQNRLIDYLELFYGTVDGASVYPREIVKAALKYNAAAMILAHNHPSGISEPSTADISITKRIIEALALIDVRVLDHIIVGENTTSLAERGDI